MICEWCEGKGYVLDIHNGIDEIVCIECKSDTNERFYRELMSGTKEVLKEYLKERPEIWERIKDSFDDKKLLITRDK